MNCRPIYRTAPGKTEYDPILIINIFEVNRAPIKKYHISRQNQDTRQKNKTTDQIFNTYKCITQTVVRFT